MEPPTTPKVEVHNPSASCSMCGHSPQPHGDQGWHRDGKGSHGGRGYPSSSTWKGGPSYPAGGSPGKGSPSPPQDGKGKAKGKGKGKGKGKDGSGGKGAINAIWEE